LGRLASKICLEALIRSDVHQARLADANMAVQAGNFSVLMKSLRNGLNVFISPDHQALALIVWAKCKDAKRVLDKPDGSVDI
jgi:hypothetical protein